MSGPVMSEAPVHDVEMGNEEVKGASQSSSEVSKPVDLGQAEGNDSTGEYTVPLFLLRQ